MPGLAGPRMPAIFAAMSDSQPKITAYLKTFCGWSEGVRAIMRKYELPFEEKDIIKNPAFRWEMEQKSGQPLSPCVEIDGTMLADISGEEVEAWMIEHGYPRRATPTPMPPPIPPAPTSSTKPWPAVKCPARRSVSSNRLPVPQCDRNRVHRDQQAQGGL